MLVAGKQQARVWRRTWGVTESEGEGNPLGKFSDIRVHLHAKTLCYPTLIDYMT